MHCAYCQKWIYNRKKKISHVNIEQNPKKLYFCSKKCKIEWIFKKKKFLSKLAIILGEY